jgi:tetratricopeptide (TPR) repeat protein
MLAPARPLFFLILFTLAVTARAHPEIEAALARLNAAIATAPSNADLYLERGELYARHEDWSTAEANYLFAAEIAPTHPRVPLVRGALELATGRPREACTHLDVVLARQPHHAEARVYRARAYRALGSIGPAAADFEVALNAIATPPPELFLERAALLAPAAALRSLDDAIARLGPAVSLQLKALALEESLGRIDAAVARLDRMIERSERKETWLKRRGDLLARAGRSREAQAAYVSALSAIARLPDWLRGAPDTQQLLTELSQLTASRS